MIWILITSWAVAAGQFEDAAFNSVQRRYAVAMQEFNDVEHCKFASVEVQKLAPGVRVVCVPKGEKK